MSYVSVQKQPPEVYYMKGVLKNFTKFTGKHLWQSLFFKNEILAQVFSCEFCEIFKNTLFTEHLRLLLSVFTCHGDYMLLLCYYLRIMDEYLQYIQFRCYVQGTHILQTFSPFLDNQQCLIHNTRCSRYKFFVFSSKIK